MNLILAAGSQQRWNENNAQYPEVKQLLEIDGETLIERIQRQFPGVVVTNHLKIVARSKKVYRPKKYRWTIETLLDTEELWEGQVRILLGDVYYTDEAAETINECDCGLQFFGTNAELFAISFNDFPFVKHNLEKCVRMHEEDNQLEENGRLWTLYRLCEGLKIDDHSRFAPKNLCPKGAFTYINDETQDFDTVEDIEHFKI